MMLLGPQNCGLMKYDLKKEEEELEELRRGVQKLRQSNLIHNENLNDSLDDIEDPNNARSSRAVTSALRALQTRIATLTRENELLSSQCHSSIQNNEAELAEVKLKYQEVKHRLKESLKTNLNLEQKLKLFQAENDRSNLQYTNVQNENSKLKLRIENLLMQQEEFREETTKTSELLENDIRVYKEKLENAHHCSLVHLREKLETLQNAFVDLSKEFNGQNKLKKMLVKQQKQSKRKINSLKKENTTIRTRYLAQPKKPAVPTFAKKTKKRKVKINRKTIKSSAPNLSKPRPQKKKIKKRKKKNCNSKTKFIKSRIEIPGGEAAIYEDKNEEEMDPLTSRRDYLDQVIQSLTRELNELQNSYVTAIRNVDDEMN